MVQLSPVPPCFWCQKKYQYRLTEISPESSTQIVSALGLAVTWDDNIENYPYFELFFDIP